MKKIITLVILVSCFILTACNDKNVGIIGGSDGPTSIIVAEKKDDIRRSYNVKKYFRENYVNKLRLPILDIHVENPFVSDDRVLVLDDTIENNLEFMIYEYYKNRMSGAYKEVKDDIVGEYLLLATENEEKNFKDGIYYSKIILDDIDIVDKDELDDIIEENKHSIIETLNELEMTEFAIVEVDKTIKLNKKFISMGPQVGDGEVTRYYLLGKIDNTYKIVEVYWESFFND